MLPITCDPLKYGQIINIINNDNINTYFIQINKLNTAVINSNKRDITGLIVKNFNLFTSGDLIITYVDQQERPRQGRNF